MKSLVARVFSSRLSTAIASSVLTVIAVGTVGAAIASIPSTPDGVITGCYSEANGALRVIDKQAGASCKKNEIQVSWNQRGANGEPGATGPAGATGATGASGPAGTNGTNGATGATGPAGTNGTNGTTGATGPAGTNGATGPEGATGATGATGPAGTNGSNGATGATGPAGTNGTDGATGPEGPEGPTGATGPTGPAGTNGTNGATGPSGPAGATGATGPAGGPTVISGAVTFVDPTETSGFIGVGGEANLVGTAADAASEIPAAGTFSGFRGHLTTPAGDIPVTFTLFVNGSATGVTCSITVAASSCVDNTHTAAVSAGDVVAVQVVKPGGLLRNVRWSARLAT